MLETDDNGRCRWLGRARGRRANRVGRRSFRRRALVAGVGLLLAIVFVTQKLRLGPVLMHQSPLGTALISAVIWTFPLVIAVIFLASGSDTLRAMVVASAVGLVPVIVFSLLAAVFLLYEGGSPRQAEVVVGSEHFAAYFTGYQGALGDFSLEVWRETPVGLGFRLGKMLPVGGQGDHLEDLRAVDENCVEVRYTNSGQRERLLTRVACVD